MISDRVPYQKFKNPQNAACHALRVVKTPEITSTVEFLSSEARANGLQNNYSKHRLKLPGGSASVLEKYFSMDVFFI